VNRFITCLSFVIIFISYKEYGQSPLEKKQNNTKQTIVSIKKDKFLINEEVLNKGKVWQNKSIEGLLFNSRMVQAIFDDENPETRALWKYPDTQIWDADRNTSEFVNAMQTWKSYGLNAITLNMQGGSPTGYGNKGWINSAYDADGNIKSAYWKRLDRVLKKADELQIVVILGLFYFGQDQILKDEKAVINAVDNTINKLHESNYKNIVIEIANECDLDAYDHKIIREDRIHELIDRVKMNKKNGFRYLVSTSFKGGSLPTKNVVKASDYILIHGNGVEKTEFILKMILDTQKLIGRGIKPIVFNEDDHYDYDKKENNFRTAIVNNASWGFFDFRRPNEPFTDGYQSIPVDWGINSDRKKQFFEYLKTIVTTNK
jgi:hypothetical protein